jgi:hypothetical protein
MEHTREQSRRNIHGSRKEKEELHGNSAAGTLVGTFMGSAKEEHSWEPCKRTYVGKSKEEIHENSALGIVMGSAQEEHALSLLSF